MLKPADRIKNLFSVFLFLLCFTIFPTDAGAVNSSGKYDIAFLWSANFDNLLEYKEDVEDVLLDLSSKLRIVRKGKEFGLIYDRDMDKDYIEKILIVQNRILENRGLHPAIMIKDSGYDCAYNVSYGYGPNFDALRKRFSTIYRHLGTEVGKSLFIEKANPKRYALVYRRRGTRNSSAKVARRHSKLLRSKKIKATIICENDNEVILGESNFLDQNFNLELAEKKAASAAKKTTKKTQKKATKKSSPSPTKKQVQTITPVKIIKKTCKTAVTDRKHLAKIKKKKTSPQKSITGKNKSQNQALEEKINSYIKRIRKKGRIKRDEKTSWLVYDISSKKYLADINANTRFQAASMIKPFVALAFFHKVKKGHLVYGRKSRRKMQRMIQRSSNSSTNWVLRYAGGPRRVQKMISNNYVDILKTVKLVEYIPPGGQTYNNAASALDYSRFLNAIWHNQLPYSRELKRLMSLPGSDRIYTRTKIPHGTIVYNKTGSTARLCGDMGLLLVKGKNKKRYPYIFVGIIEKDKRTRNYGRWIASRGNIIRAVSDLAYEEMKKNYNL
jgi:beta-lactamase class A